MMAEQVEEAKKEEKTDNETAKKLIVISGITSGIGAGMFKKFTKMGHTVAGFGRRKENLEALRKDTNINDELLIAELDITKQDDVLKCASTIIEKYGAPQLLIHNAGSV
eukprot:374358_1